MVIYECGNFNEAEDPPETCRYCGAQEQEENTKTGSTVVVECPGWYNDD